MTRGRTTDDDGVRGDDGGERGWQVIRRDRNGREMSAPHSRTGLEAALRQQPAAEGYGISHGPSQGDWAASHCGTTRCCLGDGLLAPVVALPDCALTAVRRDRLG